MNPMMEEEEEEDIYEVASELLRRLGDDPELLEMPDEAGNRLLHVVALSNNVALVRLLLQTGADITSANSSGSTALHIAAWEGFEGVAALLLSEGAEADIGDWRARTPLMEAVAMGRMGIMQMLVRHMGGQGLDEQDDSGNTALHYAVQSTSTERVAFLLEHGAQADVRSDDDMTPLMVAANSGLLAIVKVILQHSRADALYQMDQDGKAALHWAAHGGEKEVVRLFLLQGADPTVRDIKGRTPREVAEEWNEDVCTEDEWKADHAEILAVFEWWDGEIERRAVLQRATCLHKAYTTYRDMPTSQVPTYLEARVAAGHALPVVEVVSHQSERRVTRSMVRTAEALGRRTAVGDQDEIGGAEAGEEERRAMVEYVVNGLNQELFTELLEGFH